MFCVVLNGLTIYCICLQDSNTRNRLEAIGQDARSRIAEANPTIVKDKTYFQRYAYTAPAPIFIASTEGLGTARVRANHYDAVLDYLTEQEELKKSNAPIR